MLRAGAQIRLDGLLKVRSRRHRASLTRVMQDAAAPTEAGAKLRAVLQTGCAVVTGQHGADGCRTAPAPV
jgi:hypothetical protein